MFTEEYVAFFKGLAANNNKDWFDANRKTYENFVKKPFNNWVQELIDRTKAEIDPSLNLEVKNAIFRINRDIRFSKDKTPYKLHQGAVISSGGRKDMTVPGFYLHLGIGETHIGGGMYMPSKEQLLKIRTYFANNYKEVLKTLKDKKLNEFYPEILGEENKVLPKELKPLSEGKPLLFKKQFYYMKNYEDAEDLILNPKLTDIVLEHFKAGHLWNELIKKAIA